MENSNSRPTGSPRRLGEILPPTSRSTVRSVPPNSATTSTTGAARTSAVTQMVGTSATSSGAMTTQNGPGRWEKAQLAPFNLPAETRRSTTSSLLSAIVHVPGEVQIAKDGQWMPSKLRFQMKLGMPRAEIQHNLRAVVASLAQARQSDVAPIVATLKARTRGRAEGEGEARFNANVLVADLCGYPTDVVRAACDAWIDTEDGKWFPAWADLKALCEERVEGRKRLEKALNWMLEQTP